MRTRYKGIPESVKRTVYLRAGGHCEGILEDGTRCQNRGTWPGLAYAHIKHRKMGGSRLLDYPENIKLLCHSCHVKFDREKVRV